MSDPKVLIVDDEPDIRELLNMTLSRMGLAVSEAADLGEARQALAGDHFDFCLTDMKLPDGNGLDLVKEISEEYPHLPTAMITAHGKVEDAVVALKHGAFDFVSKPVDLNVLRKLVKTALKLRQETGSKAAPSTNQDQPPPTNPKEEEILSRLSGESEAVQLCRNMIKKLARSQAPVLISGESGSGKELAARLVHDLSPRADGAFVPVNCGAIPSELMESEFFGHKKGSFTGADHDKQGLFQAADGGTLLLDEVADLPLSMQVKLLRAIQEKAVRPIGGREEIPVDVRILSATHKPLKPLIDSGQFRSDLYFRLNVIELPMPSLRDRREDIPALAKEFLKKISDQWGNETPPELSAGAINALQNHRLNGNVRELINILQRAVTLCEGDVIEATDLMLDSSADPALDEAAAAERPDDVNLDDYMENLERQMLEKALIEAKYNKTRAAEILGISFRSFRYKLKKYGIE